MTIANDTFESAEIILPQGRTLPPELEKTTQFFYVSHKGIRLRVVLASAAQDEPRGSIIFSPGRTEFIEKYLETIADFTKRGFNVFMVDPRGQGLSDRLLDDKLKSYVADFQDYADDLAFAAGEFDALLPKPHIVMGHSMGGTIALQSVISGALNPDAVICSAPMLGLFDLDTIMMRFTIQSLSALGFSKNNLPFQAQRRGMPVAFASNKLTSDKERYKIWASFFQSTPRLRVGPPTFGWISAALRSMAQLNRNADKLRIPALLIGAGGDPIVDPASVSNFADKCGGKYVVVPGALHELFLERDILRDQAFAAIDSFLEENKL